MSLPDDFQHRPWFDSPPWWCPIHCPKPDNVRFCGIILRAYVRAFVFFSGPFPSMFFTFLALDTRRARLSLFLFVHPRDNKESRQVEIAQFHLSWEAKEMIRLKLQFGKLVEHLKTKTWSNWEPSNSYRMMGISCHLCACAGNANNCYTVICKYMYIYKGHLQKKTATALEYPYIWKQTSFSDSTKPIKHRNASAPNGISTLRIPTMRFKIKLPSSTSLVVLEHAGTVFTNQTPKAFWECTRWFQIGNGLISRGVYACCFGLRIMGSCDQPHETWQSNGITWAIFVDPLNMYFKLARV